MMIPDAWRARGHLGVKQIPLAKGSDPNEKLTTPYSVVQ